MYPLFESIKVTDGRFVNLDWHQQRVDKSRKSVIGNVNQLSLEARIDIPEEYGQGIVKCRVSYGETLGPVVFSKYHKHNNTLAHTVAR